ncbi:MAG: signal peptide peptidase SppA [Bacteroidetes bacterium CG2_30_33_31]|nr:MAG: signal peptide peptidase SppA [Bacteroidetes bacterium CG2_30_33_31]
MKSFFKYTFASVLGTFITLAIIFFLFLGIALSVSEKEPVTVKSNSILKISLSKPITEREPINPLSEFGLGDNNYIQGLNSVLASIKQAKEDPNIKGIYLDAGIIAGGGLATLEEIRNALLDFKKSGKFIISYAENYSQKAYYVASVSDKIYINPMGIIDFKGLYAQIAFFKNALDKLDIQMQIIRGPGNKFKSAVEPFILDRMSEANKEQTSVFLSSLWENMLTNISKSRNISVKKLQQIADNLTTYDTDAAFKNGIVDGLKYLNEVNEELKILTKTPKNKELTFINIGEYQQTLKIQNRKSKNKIALIYASGEIVSGEGDDETIGSDRLAAAISDARKDISIKAIVLRVNSPGGSALASEIIYHELILAKAVKPVVISMGDYAASGGYYISCMANKIFAQPNTITGSIGVFGMIPNIKNFVNNKLGITFDGVKTGENADMSSIVKPLSEFQTETIRNAIDHIYNTFIGHVADGRNLSKNIVDSMAQGRVWSGTDAKKLGLVDELGNIDNAIAMAAKLAKLENYRITELPKQKTIIEEILRNLNSQTSAILYLKNNFGVYGQYINYLKTIDQKDNYQARIPYIIDIQ